MASKTEIFTPGDFIVGCNYWASHAGTNMWREWNETVVEADLKRLAAAHLDTLRIFPLWPDFQPLKMHRRWAGYEREIRMGEEPLPYTEAGRAGISEVMIERFERFLNLAHEHGFRLIVGLVTGWMSGRLFVPEMLEGRNVLTDPLAIKWQVKYVRYMVRRFRNHPAIVAWDLGNECNCMGELKSSEQLYAWMAAISLAIRAEDGNRPVISGMHGIRPQTVEEPADQGDLTDILCTHPYPIFTPHCDTDPINCMKSALHAVAESRMSVGLSGKPCFAEEVGTLGPMIASDEIAAAYIRCLLFGLWAYDCRGLLWWCANEQLALANTPYDWSAVERELGLFRQDGSPKPVLGEMTSFADFHAGLESKCLPDRIVDAVCILTREQDTWAAAYGSFILAKQAGLDLEFAWCEDEIPAARSYLLPSLASGDSLPRRVIFGLLERVKAGATLYLSIDNALLSPLSEYTGLRVLTRSRRIGEDTVRFEGEVYHLGESFNLRLESVGAEVLAKNQDGYPVFSKNRCGEGAVYFLNYPLEKITATYPGVVDGPIAQPLYKFYRAMGLASPERTAFVNENTIGLTEHIADQNHRFVVLQNFEPADREISVALSDGWQCASLACVREDASLLNKCEDGFMVRMRANSGALIDLRR